MSRRFESLATASGRTGVSVKTLRRRIADGALPGFRSGRLLRVDPEDVDLMFRAVPAAQVRRRSGRAGGS